MVRLVASSLALVLFCGIGFAYGAGETDPGIRIEEVDTPDSDALPPREKKVAPDVKDEKMSREERERLKDELLLYSMQKSPAGAWAMSFFIGLAVPFLGSGQYYAHSIGTAIPTTILGAASYGCMIGVLMTKNPYANIKTLGIAALGVYGAAWLFDWIYAIVATNKYNERLREKYFPSAGTITPRFDYMARPSCVGGKTDHSLAVGLALLF
ncbi:MAG: hypothetical protein E4G96_03975 [Chrysiogenales bacterium]|nr:MAG: hypothetical protein E4G96_03975 [Chrysiogenales bacterium]